MALDNELLDDMHLSEKVDISNFVFPLTFTFKIGTIANDFTIKDANQSTIAYVRQKLFKFKEAIMIYAKEDKKDLIYTINADRVIDFNANYQFKNQDDEILGRVGRRGMKSLWKASYEIFDNENTVQYRIGELNPWAKVGDALLGEVPVLSLFSGYLFNPKYGLTTPEGNLVAKLSKQPSFFGRSFKLDKIDEFKKEESERIILSMMMMLLLERRRG